MQIKQFLFTSVIFLLVACNEEVNYGDRSYPSLNTLPVTNISVNGATLRAEIIYIPSAGASDHGFLYTSSDLTLMDLSNSQKISLGSRTQTGIYSASLPGTNLSSGTTYVRAYAVSTNGLFRVYGQIMKFKN